MTQNHSPIMRSKFTSDEDALLIQAVQRFGILNWKTISNQIKTKNARQCKERWDNYLNPSINTSEWSSEEDDFLLKKFEEFGPKWVKISKFFFNRTDTQCKNRIQKLKRRFNRCNELIKEIENVSSFKVFQNQEQIQNENSSSSAEIDLQSFSEPGKLLFDETDFFNFDFESNGKDFFIDF
jgi:hypothetical protein